MTPSEAQRARGAAFRNLHTGPDILVLPCAWDAASAVICEWVGFPAVGTTSGGIAHSLGYSDGERMAVEEMVGAVARIVRAVSVPVSADLEAGYSSSVEGVTRNVRAVIDAGAVGVNLEDGLGEDADPLVDLDHQVDVIASVVELADSLDLPFVVNARTDVYLREAGAPDERFELAVERANAYRRAGADCLFVPGVSDPELIGRLVEAIDGPVNILAFGPDAPSPSQLEGLGVARVSTGSGPMRMAMATLRRFGEDVCRTGEFPASTGEQVSRAELQRTFDRLSG